MARIIDAPLLSDPSGGCAPNVAQRFGNWAHPEAAKARGLEYTPEVKAETDALYERVKHVVPAIEWPAYAPLIAAINRIKKQKNAVVLAHNYMTTEIFHCVGDSKATASNSRAKPPTPAPTSSCKPASTSWPRPPRFSRRKRPC